MSPTVDARIRDDFNRRRLKDVDALSRKLAKEQISVRAWEQDMRATIEKHWTVQYMHGRGGRNAMQADDRALLKALIREQWNYLHGFAGAVQEGQLSAKQIKARAHLYLNDSVRAHSEGKASAHGIRLPAHPGDGTSECKANCRCHWEIAQTETEFKATWRRSAAESCPTCKHRSRQWAPLTISKQVTRMRSAA
jgi:hypothetical protein